MSNVIQIGGYTKLPIDPNKVLDAAKDRLDFVFVAGHDNEGNEYFACSNGKEEDIDKILYLIGRFQFKLFNGEFK